MPRIEHTCWITHCLLHVSHRHMSMCELHAHIVGHKGDFQKIRRQSRTICGSRCGDCRYALSMYSVCTGPCTAHAWSHTAACVRTRMESHMRHNVLTLRRNLMWETSCVSVYLYVHMDMIFPHWAGSHFISVMRIHHMYPSHVASGSMPLYPWARSVSVFDFAILTSQPPHTSEQSLPAHFARTLGIPFTHRHRHTLLMFTWFSTDKQNIKMRADESIWVLLDGGCMFSIICRVGKIASNCSIVFSNHVIWYTHGNQWPVTLSSSVHPPNRWRGYMFWSVIVFMPRAHTKTCISCPEVWLCLVEIYMLGGHTVVCSVGLYATYVYQTSFSRMK